MRTIRLALLGTLALGAAGAAVAQDDEELEPVARAVVQPLPNQSGAQLNAALSRLAANPRDVTALLDAGNAALTLGDTEAALGFYGRADELAPSDPRVKSAMAMAMVRNEDPFGAIPLFEAAARAGARDPVLAGDRGLAYDLVGAHFEAQRYYREALAAAPGNEEIARRLALSLAIAGDRKASEAALLPQLRRNAAAAWRTRAFALAILGDTEEAVRIAQGTMPRDLSDAIVPYLRYMGRLTPSQQAAAANFGHFPRAAQIGRDDPRVARYAALNPRKPVITAAVATKADPQAKKSRDRREDRRERERRKTEQARPVLAANTAKPPVARQTPTPLPTPLPRPTPAPAARLTPPPVRVAAATPNPGASALPTPSPSPPASAAVMPQGPAFTTLATRPAISAPTPAPTPSPTPSAVPDPVRVATAAPESAGAVLAPAVAVPAPASSGPPAAGLALASSSLSLPPSNLELARRSQQATTVAADAAPAPTATPVSAVPQSRRDLASAFGDFKPPEGEASEAASVDLAAIERERVRRAAAAAKAEDRGPPPEAPRDTRRVASAEPPVSTTGKKPDPKAKSAVKDDKKAARPEPPKQPSRIWVQIGVGRDKSALGFDWRKYARTEAALFKGRKGWTTPWGQTNRLLVGPFETQAAAQAFLKDARKAGLDAFVWTSPTGQAIDALAVK